MNEPNAYNLVDERWIPVLTRSGENRAVSLADIFADDDGDIADLALNPYERIAVFRLLLCIAQAALGPERLADETAWLAARDSVGPAAARYLQKWHARFFLYGPHALLQPDDAFPVSADGLTSCDKLAFHCASGNNSTLFDHAAGTRSRPDAALALALLAYQNFSSGGLSGKCVWSGVETDKSVKGAPCREQSMLFSILLGGTLLETVWLNLLTVRSVREDLAAEWGVPAWELPSLSRADSADLARTFLGHLVPLSRAVKLARGVPVCTLGGGVPYPQLPEWREPMAAVKPTRDERPSYVSADPARLPWLDLSSILAVRQSALRKSALALRHLDSLPEETAFSLWTGGLYAEKAKEIDVVEWKADLSVALLEESALRQYETALALADRQRAHLYVAAQEYATAMAVAETARFAVPAERAYWDLLALSENQRTVMAVDSPAYLDDWKTAVRAAAEEAYRRACPAATARQTEAFVQGFAKLRMKEEN